MGEDVQAYKPQPIHDLNAVLSFLLVTVLTCCLSFLFKANPISLLLLSTVSWAALWIRRYRQDLSYRTVGYAFGIGVACLLWSRHFPKLWDSYSYHLPVAVDIARHGLFHHFEYYGVSIGSYYPIGIHPLWGAWLSNWGIAHSSLVNLPAVLLIFIAIRHLTIKLLGFDTIGATLASAAFLTLPLLARSWFEAYVDLYFLGFLLSAVVYFIRAQESRQSQDIVWMLISAGLMASTKTRALPLWGVFWVLAIWLVRRRDKAVTLSGPGLLATVILAQVPFILSLVRNDLNTGNPLYPLRLGSWLPGHYSSQQLIRATSLLYEFQRTDIGRMMNTIYGELGCTIGLAFFVIGVVLLVLRCRALDCDQRRRAAWFATAAIGLLIWFAVTPYSYLSTQGGYNFSLRFYASGLFAIFLIAVYGYLQVSRRLALMACLVLIVSNSRVIVAPLLKRDVWLEPALPSDKIAYAGSNRHFQWMDQRVTRDLIYLPVDRPMSQKWNAETDLRYHKTAGDFGLWLENIRDSGVVVLVLNEEDNDNAEFVEKTWVRNHPELFVKISDKVYRIDTRKVADLLKGSERLQRKQVLVSGRHAGF